MTCQLGGLGHGWRAMLLTHHDMVEPTQSWGFLQQMAGQSPEVSKLGNSEFQFQNLIMFVKIAFWLGFLHYSHAGILII